MGQIGATDVVTASHPSANYGSAYLLDLTAVTITVQFTNEVQVAGSNGACLGYCFWSPSITGTPSTQIGATVGPFGAFPGPTSFTFSAAGIPAGSYVFAGFGPNTGPNTIQMEITLFDDVVYCAYGSREQASVPALVELTPALLALVAGAVTDGWAWPLAALFIGRYLDVSTLCSTNRPNPVFMTLRDLQDALLFPPTAATIPAVARAYAWLQWAAWPQFCECVPGIPAPHPNPPIIQPKPIGAPAGPLAGFQCNNEDLCSQIEQLTLAVSALSQAQRNQALLVQLIQRQAVPFAYLGGVNHIGLTGAGTFVVDGILGLSITSSVIPPWLSAAMEPVNSYFRLGEISFGTVDGWVRRQIVTHDPHLILDVPGDITRVAYAFEPGVTASILELVREP